MLPRHAKRQPPDPAGVMPLLSFHFLRRAAQMIQHKITTVHIQHHMICAQTCISSSRMYAQAAPNASRFSLSLLRTACNSAQEAPHHCQPRQNMSMHRYRILAHVWQDLDSGSACRPFLADQMVCKLPNHTGTSNKQPTRLHDSLCIHPRALRGYEQHCHACIFFCQERS